MNLAALADFLEARGLLLRGARVDPSSDNVSEFTCEARPLPPDAPAVDAPAVGGRTFVEEPAKQPDALDDYLNRKAKRPPDGGSEGEVTP